MKTPSELTHITEQLATIAERLERILSAQADLLATQKEVVRALHPAEMEKRTMELLAQWLKQTETQHLALERKLTIRFLSTTALFGFIVAVVQWIGK